MNKEKIRTLAFEIRSIADNDEDEQEKGEHEATFPGLRRRADEILALLRCQSKPAEKLTIPKETEELIEEYYEQLEPDEKPDKETKAYIALVFVEHIESHLQPDQVVCWPDKETKAYIALVFVEHIESHLQPDQVVCCKICGKNINEIALLKLKEPAEKPQIDFDLIRDEIYLKDTLAMAFELEKVEKELRQLQIRNNELKTLNSIFLVNNEKQVKQLTAQLDAEGFRFREQKQISKELTAQLKAAAEKGK